MTFKTLIGAQLLRCLPAWSSSAALPLPERQLKAGLLYMRLSSLPGCLLGRLLLTGIRCCE